MNFTLRPMPDGPEKNEYMEKLRERFNRPRTTCFICADPLGDGGDFAKLGERIIAHWQCFQRYEQNRCGFCGRGRVKDSKVLCRECR